MPAVAEILDFPEGLAGFPEIHQLRLREPDDDYPLGFLQAVEEPGLSFVCLNAASVKPDYHVPLSEEEARALDLQTQAEALILLLVVVPEDPRQMTANLAAPLVVNTRTRQGRQLMLDPKVYPLQHPILAPKAETIVEFPDGLLGFPKLRHFRLYEPKGAYPLKFLQSVEQEDVSFTCIDIVAIKPDYEVAFSAEDAAVLRLESPGDALLLATVVVPDDPRQMTANLAGPIVINTGTLKGRQLVLSIDRYPLKYPILAER